MELSWSTFLLEILNFLVLVWILKRFFYKPLQAVIARRQAAIEQRTEEARQMADKARQLQQQYEKDLADWERGREQAREKLQREIRAERAKLEKALEDSLQQQRQKAEAVEQRRQREMRRQLEQQALEQGGRFAARLLQQGAGPELQQRLLELLLRSLDELPEEQRQPLRQQLAELADAAEITSAFPLAKIQRQELEQVLREILQANVPCHYVEDPELLAGLRIDIGSWQLGASVRDELEAFAQLPKAGP